MNIAATIREYWGLKTRKGLKLNLAELGRGGDSYIMLSRVVAVSEFGLNKRRPGVRSFTS